MPGHAHEGDDTGICSGVQPIPKAGKDFDAHNHKQNVPGALASHP